MLILEVNLPIKSHILWTERDENRLKFSIRGVGVTDLQICSTICFSGLENISLLDNDFFVKKKKTLDFEVDIVHKYGFNRL